MDAGFYSAPAYVVSLISVAAPMVIIDATLFGSIVYFMSGLALNAGCYFFFIMTLCLMGVNIATILRLFGFSITNAAVASSLAAPIITILNIFGKRTAR